MIVLRRVVLALGAGLGAAALTFVNLPTRAHPGIHSSRATPVGLFYTEVPASGDADHGTDGGATRRS